MNKLLVLLCSLALTACATHTPPPEPKGTPFPINGHHQKDESQLISNEQHDKAEYDSAESR